jgi:flagellar basal-body rod modification protein FlgD
MDVTATTQMTKPVATPTAQQNNDKNYDTFLKMMTTQIKNQDPLNPMSADQLAVQLATFSGVEQQTKTNDLLGKLLNQNALGGMGQMVGWVGKDARLAGPTYFDGSTPVTISPNPTSDATSAVLVVKDSNGQAVARTQLPLGSADYSWQGLDSTGAPLPKGIYTLSLESYQDTKLLESSTVEYYGRISEIRSSANGVTAMLPGGVEALTSLVTAIREPATN